MSNELEFNAEINCFEINHIIKKVYQFVKENKNSSNQFDYEDTIFGKVSYTIIGNEIKISFSSIKEEYSILKHYLFLVNEKKNKNRILFFTKRDLENAFEIFGKRFYFLVENKIMNSATEIFDLLPEKVILRKKESDDMPLDVFKCLNNKKNISNENSILIDTNELISQDMKYLGIYRDNNINLVIKKRDELINEIKDFMDEQSEEVIMKIYGVNGIGKSLTLIYLTSLINNFKIIYFNLKEFHWKQSSQLINMFKFQLANYYTQQVDLNIEQEQKDIINKKAYEHYIESMKKLDKKIEEKYNIDFWDLLNIFLNMLSIYSNQTVLVIIDQYKIENDPKNKLNALEEQITNDKSFIKLLIVSSLNDKKTKNEFILHLNNCLKKQKKSIQKIDIVSHSEEKIEDIFVDFHQTNESFEKNDDDFEKIKAFGEDNEINMNKYNIDISEDTYIEKIEYFLDNNKYKIDDICNNKKYRLIYINDLVSFKYLINEDNKFIDKLKEFNYNPKYSYKLKYSLEQDLKNKSLNEAYNNFLFQIYDNIKNKILEFKEIFYRNFNLELKKRDIVLILFQLKKIVEEKIELNLESLIYYLNKFPIKYLKIIPNDGIKNKTILQINEGISNTKFRIEYIFPFLKIVINRLIFEYGINRDIKFNDFPSNEKGIFLEKLIRNSILNKQQYGNFHLRNVWSFTKSLYKKEKMISKKNTEIKEEKNINIEIENTIELKEENNIDERLDNAEIKKGENDEIENNEKIEFKIDFFNLKELTYDDKISNPLINYNWKYYIVSHKPNNPFLDCIMLIPHSDNNEIDKMFNLLAFQITPKKCNINSLKEYNEATKLAADTLKNIYKIEIKDKFFSFILSDELENSKTQDDLIKFGIPFVFYSAINDCFLFNNKKSIWNIEQFFNNEFNISNNENNKKLFTYRKYLFKNMEKLLEKKRKREKEFKITKNVFNFAREKLLEENGELVLTKEIRADIIKIIQNSNFFKNKKITIEFAFRIKFIDFFNLFLDTKNTDLLGIYFYETKLFIINFNLNSKITIVSKNEEQKILSNFWHYINGYNPEKDKETSDYPEKVPSLDNLMKYNINKPSEIFVFRIYELN